MSVKESPSPTWTWTYWLPLVMAMGCYWREGECMLLSLVVVGSSSRITVPEIRIALLSLLSSSSSLSESLELLLLSLLLWESCTGRSYSLWRALALLLPACPILRWTLPLLFTGVILTLGRKKAGLMEETSSRLPEGFLPMTVLGWIPSFLNSFSTKSLRSWKGTTTFTERWTG